MHRKNDLAYCKGFKSLGHATFQKCHNLESQNKHITTHPSSTPQRIPYSLSACVCICVCSCLGRSKVFQMGQRKEERERIHWYGCLYFLSEDVKADISENRGDLRNKDADLKVSGGERWWRQKWKNRRRGDKDQWLRDVEAKIALRGKLTKKDWKGYIIIEDIWHSV